MATSRVRDYDTTLARLHPDIGDRVRLAQESGIPVSRFIDVALRLLLRMAEGGAPFPRALFARWNEAGLKAKDLPRLEMAWNDFRRRLS